MGKLFEELKRRKVFRVAAVYAVVAWLLIQIADVILPTFNAPQWVNQSLIVLLMLGFPIALVFSWAFNLTPDSVNTLNTNDNSAAISSNQSWNSIVLGLVVLAIVFLVVDRYWLTGSRFAQISPVDSSSPVTRASINLGFLSRFGPRNFFAHVALTPDGSKIAYVAYADGSRKLFIRDLSDFSSDVLLENPNDLNPRISDQSISPDGRNIFLFFGNEATILSLETGARQPLPALIRNSDSTPNAYNGRGFDWLSDEEIVYAANDGGIYVLTTSSGTITKLDVPAVGAEAVIWPHVMPDNRFLLYTVITDANVGNAQIAMFDRNTGETLTLLEGGFKARYLPTGHIVFMRNSDIRAIRFDFAQMQVIGSDVAVINDVQNVSGTWGEANFSVSESGRIVYGEGGDLFQNTARRFELRELGVEAKLLNISPSGWARLRLSPDGDKILLHSLSDGDVSIYHIDSEVIDRRTYNGVSTPIWARDGENFVYVDSTGAGFNVMQMAATGLGQPELLYSPPGRIEPFAFTPDNSQLLHTIGLPGSEDLNVTPINHEAPTSVSIVENAPSNDTNLSISPDGRWIAYNAGGSNVFVRPFPNFEDGLFQLTENGGLEPRWGPNSDELFYYNDGELLRVPLSTETGFQWGQPEVIFSDLSLIGRSFVYDVAADGKTFLVSLDTDETEAVNTPRFTTLNLVDNWFEEVNRILPSN